MTVSSIYQRQIVEPEFVANGFIGGDQRASDVLALSNGGFVVAYNNHDITDGFIVLDFYDSNHEHVRTVNAYQDGASNDKSAFEAPSLIEWPGVGIVVVWANVNGGSPGVRASFFTPTGDILAPDSALFNGNVGRVDAAAVGESVVVTYSTGSKVYFRYSDLPAIAVDPTSVDAQDYSQVVALADGGFAITWVNNPFGGIYDQTTHARVFDSHGVPRGAAFAIDATANNVTPAVAALHNGNWVIAYADTAWADEANSFGISLQIRDANGHNVTPGGEIHVNAPTAFNEQAPDVTVLANGFILVTWSRDLAAGVSDVWGRLFTQEGVPLRVGGADEFLLSSQSGEDRLPAVATMPDGSFITVWESKEVGATAFEIAAQIEKITRTTAGDDADDTFMGDALRDFVAGNGGNDTLGGGKGVDYLIGGAGSDRFVYRPGDGADTISDFTSDILVRDKLALTAFGLNFAELMAHATQVGANTLFDFGDGDTLLLLNVQKDHLVASNFAATIGDDGDNVLSGTSDDEVIQGRGGDDTMVFSQTLDQYGLTDFGNRILVSGPDGADTLYGIEHLQFADGTIHVNDGNPLFDTAYYMRHNLDVFHAGANALGHFNAIGWHEGRDPSAWFDTAGYLAVNKDVAAAGVNPLDHYHAAGWHEGRDPNAHFDTTLYLINNPDVAAAGMDPLEHYLRFGYAEGRENYPAIGPTIVGGFDAQYYLFNNRDVAAAGIDPLLHYNAVGWQEGRDPNAWFDTDGYLAHNTDVAAAGINPLWHYAVVGWKEGRDPSMWFDTDGYLAANPDVAAAHYNPLDHFLQHGIYEGRQPVNDGMWS
jgi:Ca2+-binding RTX toxin-like protein